MLMIDEIKDISTTRGSDEYCNASASARLSDLAFTDNRS